MHSPIILGVDIGGSHITSALVNLDNKQIIEDSLRRERIDSAGGSNDILDAWTAVLKESLMSAPNSRIVSIAMPGPFDYEKGISLIRGLGKYESLYGLNIKKLLMQRLDPLVDDILFTNDAACFLQGEAFSGAARNYDHVLGFTLGTGFGSAIYEDGVAREAGWWKHPLLNGICEDYFSSRWFVDRYFELSGRKVENVKAIAGNSENFQESQRIFNEFSDNLSSFLKKILNERDVKCIVLGGNITKAASLFLPQLKSNLTSIGVHLVISELGEGAALIGAASLAQSFHGEKAR